MQAFKLMEWIASSCDLPLYAMPIIKTGFDRNLTTVLMTPGQLGLAPVSTASAAASSLAFLSALSFFLKAPLKSQ